MQTFFGWSHVPPHERLLNGPVTSIRWQLANHIRAKLDFDWLWPNASTREICAAKCSTFSLTLYVQVAPATANVHIIFEVPATDKIHIEDRYGLAELSQTMGYTKRKTVNWFTRKQLHFNYVVLEGTKKAINLFIELKKHKLNQIDGRNIRTSVQKRVAFLK